MKLEDEIKQKKFTSEYHKGVVNIMYTFHWLDGKTRSMLKNFDITNQQYNILRILRGQYPQPSTVNLLKDRMLDKMSDTSRLVDRLKNKGLLLRKVCEHDKRAVDIYISEKGLLLLEEIDKVMPNFDKILSNLSDPDIRKLNELLDKIRD